MVICPRKYQPLTEIDPLTLGEMYKLIGQEVANETELSIYFHYHQKESLFFCDDLWSMTVMLSTDWQLLETMREKYCDEYF